MPKLEIRVAVAKHKSTVVYHLVYAYRPQRGQEVVIEGAQVRFDQIRLGPEGFVIDATITGRVSVPRR